MDLFASGRRTVTPDFFRWALYGMALALLAFLGAYVGLAPEPRGRPSPGSAVDPELVWDLIDGEGVTHYNGAPTVHIGVTEHPAARRLEQPVTILAAAATSRGVSRHTMPRSISGCALAAVRLVP